MSILSFHAITKRFGALTANDAISLSLEQGEILALLGENGAGKSTLMNILFGHYQADEGHIEVDGEPLPPGSTEAALAAGIGMVHQHFTLADNLSVLDNITLGTEPLWAWRRDRAGARARLAELSQRFGLAVDPDALIAELSLGEAQRVEILKALYRDARILILDEPTAVLTPQEADALFATLKKLSQTGLAVILISHKLHEILAVSDRVAVLRRGALVGEVATAEADRDRLAEMMVGRIVERPRPEPLPAGAPVLEIAGLNCPADGSRPALHDINLTIRAHEIVGIAGVAGNGQAVLADLLSGLTPSSAGEVLLHGERIDGLPPAALTRRGVGRIPEDRNATGVIGAMSVRENLMSEGLRRAPFSRFGRVLDRQWTDAHARDLIERFDVRCEGPDAETRLLSGGNVQKLILARALSPEPGFILANQPVRGLDEGAIAYVQGRLLAARAAGAGILLISEDLDELMALSDRLAVMHAGRMTAAFDPAGHSKTDIGLMMAGHGDGAAEEAAHAH